MKGVWGYFILDDFIIVTPSCRLVLVVGGCWLWWLMSGAGGLLVVVADWCQWVAGCGGLLVLVGAGGDNGGLLVLVGCWW